MKRILVAGIFGALVLVAAALVSSRPTIMKTTATVQADEGSSCSLARAAGNWSFSDTGTVIGVGPRVAAGIWTLNEAGNVLNGVATSSLNGAIADETFFGTYTVNSNCTGTISVEIFQSGTKILTVTGNLAFDDRMNELRGIFTSAVVPNGPSLSTAIALEARKQ
jgi:hypothetical protein